MTSFKIIHRDNIAPIIAIMALASYGMLTILDMLILPGFKWEYLLVLGISTWALVYLMNWVIKDMVHTVILGTLEALVEDGMITNEQMKKWEDE